MTKISRMAVTTKSEHQDDRWMGERFLDLGLQRLGFFQIGRDLVEQHLKHPGFLAGMHQAAVQIVEVYGTYALTGGWKCGLRCPKLGAKALINAAITSLNNSRCKR